MSGIEWELKLRQLRPQSAPELIASLSELYQKGLKEGKNLAPICTVSLMNGREWEGWFVTQDYKDCVFLVRKSGMSLTNSPLVFFSLKEVAAIILEYGSEGLNSLSITKTSDSSSASLINEVSVSRLELRRKWTEMSEIITSKTGTTMYFDWDSISDDNQLRISVAEWMRDFLPYLIELTSDKIGLASLKEVKKIEIIYGKFSEVVRNNEVISFKIDFSNLQKNNFLLLKERFESLL